MPHVNAVLLFAGEITAADGLKNRAVISPVPVGADLGVRRALAAFIFEKKRKKKKRKKSVLYA